MKTRFYRTGRQLLLIGLIFFTIFITLFNGCTKNNPTSPNDPNLLQGNEAFHAASVASYQSVGAGVSYVFKSLQLCSPSGSPIHNKALIKNLIHGIYSPLGKNTNELTDSLVYIPFLNLYLNLSYVSNIINASFYSDASGTQSAGYVKITLPTHVTDPTDPTSYASYPANITVEINITAGNIPCQGNLLIVFTGNSGANTMTGTNTLTRDDVVYTLNLGLDDNLNTSGSITINEKGATVSATSVNGFVLDTLNCDVSISPYNWTGTGKINLLTGSLYLNVNTGSGISTAASDSIGNLDINYGDGTSEKITNALSGGLTGGGTQTGAPKNILATSGSSQTAVLNTAFALPLVATVTDNDGNPVSGVDVNFTSPQSGQSCTFPNGSFYLTVTTNTLGQAQAFVTANDSTGNYNVTASVDGITSTVEFSLTNTSASAYNDPILSDGSQRFILTINNNGQCLGYDEQNNTSSIYHIPAFWSSPTSQSQILKAFAGDTAEQVNSMNDAGQIVGNGCYRNQYYEYIPTNPLYWSSPSASPQKLAIPENSVYTAVLSINNSGQIVGYSFDNLNPVERTYTPLYWPSPTDSPMVLQSLPDYNAGGYATMISNNGYILGTFVSINNYAISGTVPGVWVSPIAEPVVPNALPGDNRIFVTSINSTGVLVGASTKDNNDFSAVSWTSAQAPAQALPQINESNVDVFALSINTDGVIAGGTYNKSFIWKDGQAMEIPYNDAYLGHAILITDKGWILGGSVPANDGGYFNNNWMTYNQYILIPK